MTIQSSGGENMVWAVTDIAFMLAMLLVIAVFYMLSGRARAIADRLARLWEPAKVEIKLSFRERQVDRAERILKSIGKLIPARKSKRSSTELLLIRAGLYRPEALIMLRGARIFFTTGFLSLVYFTGFYQFNPFFILLIAGVLGYYAPDLWLQWRIRRRQREIQLGLPDALDLLVICVEAGLALDQALLRVAHELKIAHRSLSEELNLVSAEIRLGKSRMEALRELGVRTGVEDIRSLTAMLIQTDRFGTSIADSLRVQSETLRDKRRQRAEEAAAKTTVKMVPALVFFIFPALFVVILGPAVIVLIRQFLTFSSH
jgi:tight adherence protein C